LLKVALDVKYRLGVVFAGNELLIRTDNHLVEKVAASVFRHHVSPSVDQNCATIDVVQQEGAGDFFLMVEGQLAGIASSAAELPVMLMQLGQRLLVFKEARQAMLHAAVLAKNGRGFLFPAAAGSGKTTLTAWLLGQGYGLLSDELASIGEANTLDGFTRPLNIKPGSRALVARFDWMGAALAQSVLSSDVTLVSWDRHTVNNLCASIIVFPTYAAGSPIEVESLSQGLCARNLMASLLNARNLPKHGISFAMRLAGTCPSYRVRYSSLQDVSTWLDQILDDA
jgi:hypothetical protein